jgi:hypothetical protein
MADWPHSKIRGAALFYIRKHLMKESDWRWTVIDRLHEEIKLFAKLDADELPIVSCYVDERTWYVMTTSQIHGVHNRRSFHVSPLDIKDWHWGNFKHYGRHELELACFMLNDGSRIEMMYEAGPAAMAPIYYERFWYIKYPILHKLAV